MEGIAAGLHVTIRLPDTGPAEDAALRHGAARGLALGGLSSHWQTPGRDRQGLVVGYSTPGEGAYPAALDALVRVLRNSARGNARKAV